MINQQILEKLEESVLDMPQYYRVYCDECDFTEPCWLEQEAKVRGQVHAHKCSIQPVILDGQAIRSLGYNPQP